jgi:hypothetical protein
MPTLRDFHIPKASKVIVKPAAPAKEPSEKGHSSSPMKRRSTKKLLGTPIFPSRQSKVISSIDPINFMIKNNSVNDERSESIINGSDPKIIEEERSFPARSPGQKSSNSAIHLIE